MTEQFALEQFGWNRRAVHGDEGTPCALTVTMDGASHEFFSSARFAEDKHGRIARSGDADELFRAGNIDLSGRDRWRMSERTREHAANVIAANRLRQMVERAEFHRLDGVGTIGERGENHDRRGCAIGMRFKRAEHFKSVHSAQAQIEKNQRGPDFIEARKGVFARWRNRHLVAKIAHRLCEARCEASVVFNDQDFRHGNSISKRAPFVLSTQRSVPPCASTISRAMLSPSPAPFPRVLTNGSNIFSRCSGAMPGPESSIAMRQRSLCS